ncbi:MAG TPA: YhbY family RNA-binding protein [Clostridiales bacterium]|nr:YhbY family RNA-binding protein [Clostridiales bacterium]
MSLTSKQRAQLRGMASTQETIIHIGKGGINENVIKQVEDALKARELIKGSVLENSPISAREACDWLAEVCTAEPVQVIGRKFVLYKRNDKEPKIVLVKDSKK